MMYAAADKAQLNGRTRAMKNAASKTAGRIEDDADDAVSTIFEAAASIREDVEDLADSAGRKMREVIDRAETSVTEVTGNAIATIRENAVQSSVIALCAGALIGFMFRGSARR